MKTCRTLIVAGFVFFWAQLPLAASPPVVVSLGSDCQVARGLNNLQLREAAYPFDWVVTEDFDSVIDAMEDDFQCWLDPRFLEYRGKYIHNTHYNISFVHDFPIIGREGAVPEGDYMSFGKINPAYLHHLPFAVEKFIRRIDRLRALLNSTETVVFVRAYATPHSAKRFVDFITTKFPHLQFTLVVVCRAGLLNPSWDIDHVINVYQVDDKHVPYAWWWNGGTWRCIFKSVGLLK